MFRWVAFGEKEMSKRTLSDGSHRGVVVFVPQWSGGSTTSVVEVPRILRTLRRSLAQCCRGNASLLFPWHDVLMCCEK